MASESERDDFQQILHQIGGKSNVHLISAASEADGCAGVLKDFIADMFNDNMREDITDCNGSSNGEIKPQTTASREDTGPSPDRLHSSMPHRLQSSMSNRCTSGERPEALRNKIVSSSRNIGGKQRSIQCSLVVFMFRHDYVCNKDNDVCLREILKDVRARVKRNALRPALLGLIYTDCSEAESRESIDVLDRSLRSVFIDHPQQAIWTGHYVTGAPDRLQEIKRNACGVVKCSMSADSSTGSKGSLFWPLKCLPGIFRKGHRGQADVTNSSCQQANPQTTEEGIPLQMRATAH